MLIDLEDDGEMPSSFSSCRFLINLKLCSPLAAVLSLVSVLLRGPAGLLVFFSLAC